MIFVFYCRLSMYLFVCVALRCRFSKITSQHDRSIELYMWSGADTLVGNAFFLQLRCWHVHICYFHLLTRRGSVTCQLFWLSELEKALTYNAQQFHFA